MCRNSPDGEWGSLREGRWTGMVGELWRDQADVIMGPLDNTLSRSTAVDFAVQFTRVRSVLQYCINTI